jgi:hypothetical protein
MVDEQHVHHTNRIPVQGIREYGREEREQEDRVCIQAANYFFGEEVVR